MVKLEICGIPVEFPFPPYDSQLIYMEKTLCLLCATLAWRRELQKKLGTSTLAPTKRPGASLAYEGYGSDGESDAPQLPRIIYSSRTHSQLKQVVQELKNTSYRPNVAILGSREHLCVNEKVSKLRGTRQNLAFFGVDSPVCGVQICPFFLTRNMLPEAEIVFVPYNYLIDPMARRSIGISIENSILIFDEAHNVESIASEAASYALSSTDISGCISEVDTFIRALSNNSIQLNAGSNLTTESTQTLRALFMEIDKGLNSFPLSTNGGFTKPGQYIFEFFEQFNVNFETCPLVLNMIEEIIEVAHGGDDSQRAASKLDTMLSFLGTIFRSKEQHLQAAKNYEFIFKKSEKVKELGIEFPVRLENNHVVDADQVWVGVVGTGVTGKKLNSSYNFRSTETYLLELGNTIVNFTRLVPHGLLVFFPSYSILEESIDKWQRPAAGESALSIWDRIVQQKQTFVEPRGRADFKAVVDEYHQAIADNPKGAVFFAVSEGIDFSNDKGRAVVITGLPFPPTKDPKIILKKSILDEAIAPPGELKLTGNAWYIQQASRAVNQAIGRVIRHRHDYGAIILLDERFALKQQQECLSKWLQPYCHTCRGYAIGDGQSYVNPQLLRHPPDPSDTTACCANSFDTKASCASKTFTGVALDVHVKSAMVDMTSSISRPFTTPKMCNGGGCADSAIVIDDDDARSWQSAKQQFAAKQEIGNAISKEDSDKTSAVEFPVVARKVLQPADVPKLYSFIRQLHAGEDVETALSGICNLLRDPACKELLDLMPKVLNGAMCDRFIGAAQDHGLEVSIGGRAQHSTARARPTDMSTFFERLQQKKRKTHRDHVPIAAVVKDPQCFVCYDITRKAYASPQCGHICCHPCWKKMEKDGFTSCPVCKIPIKLEQLSLIRAAKDSSGHHDTS
ncbi:P-loop containing nucleoside triphosphate hydrolase [Phytophthora cactorum]|nr:P-loop containing nucleoside triphosphate hydrolase [Phytophthora cactorum]